MKYIVGIDLGQLSDRAALSVIERKVSADRAAPLTYQCKWLQVWNPGTQHPKIVDDAVHVIKTLLAGTPAPVLYRSTNIQSARPREAGVSVALDTTVVGASIGIMFESQFKALGVRTTRFTITAGTQVAREAQPWRVPKRDLGSVMRVLLEGRRISFAPGLQHGAELIRELSNFKIDKATGDDNQIDWRTREHDDLVLATALACWLSEHGMPKVARVATSHQG